MSIGVTDGCGVLLVLSTLDGCWARRWEELEWVSSCVTTISGTTAVSLCTPRLWLLGKKRSRRRITRYSRCFSSVCVCASLSVSRSSARRQKAVWKELSCILLLLHRRRRRHRASLLRLPPFFGISSANLIISIVEPAGCVCARMNRKPRMTRCYHWLKWNEVRGEKLGSNVSIRTI